MVVKRMLKRAMVEGFDAWRENTSKGKEGEREQKQRKARALKIVTRILNHVLVEAYETWREHAREVLEHKRKALKIVKRMLNRVLVEGFDVWRERAWEEHQHKRKTLKIVQRRVNHVVVERYERWREHTRGERRLRAKGVQVSYRRIKGALKRAVSVLAAYCARRGWLLQVGSRLMLGWMDCIIRSLVCEWYACAANSRRQRRVRDAAQQHKRVRDMIAGRALAVSCWQWWSTVWSWRSRRRVRGRACLRMLSLVRDGALIRHTWDAWFFFHTAIQFLNNPSHGVNKILRIRNPPSLISTSPPPTNRGSPVRGGGREGGEGTGGGGRERGLGSGPLHQLSPLRSSPRDASPAKAPRSDRSPTGRGGGGNVSGGGHAGGKATPRGGRVAFAKGPVMERVVRYSYSKALDQWLTSELQVARYIYVHVHIHKYGYVRLYSPFQ